MIIVKVKWPVVVSSCPTRIRFDLKSKLKLKANLNQNWKASKIVLKISLNGLFSGTFFKNTRTCEIFLFFSWISKEKRKWKFIKVCFDLFFILFLFFLFIVPQFSADFCTFCFWFSICDLILSLLCRLLPLRLLAATFAARAQINLAAAVAVTDILSVGHNASAAAGVAARVDVVTSVDCAR